MSPHSWCKPVEEFLANFRTWFKINSVFGYILLDHTVHSEVLIYQYLCTVQERGTTHDCITHDSKNYLQMEKLLLLFEIFITIMHHWKAYFISPSAFLRK